MPQLIIHTKRGLIATHLAGSTLVGRHWSCLACLPIEAIPLFWLELRWTGNNWVWRSLRDDGLTRGPGSVDAKGWRALHNGKTTPRIHGPSGVEIRFDELGPPQAFLQKLTDDEQLIGEALDEHLELWEGQALSLGWEDRPGEKRHIDGDVLVIRDDSYRLHLPSDEHMTGGDGCDLRHPNITFEIDLSRLFLRVSGPSFERQCHGEFVRMLAVFAQQRCLDEVDEGGWLNGDEAYAAWLELGGNPASPSERLGWDRGKLRNALARSGFYGLAWLFERQRSARRTRIRLALSAAQIDLGNDAQS